MKVMTVAMPDGSVWAIPASLIDADRNAYYKSREEDFEDEESDDEDLTDWAANNMNWSDVKDRAVLLKKPSSDYQEGWINGEKRVITQKS